MAESIVTLRPSGTAHAGDWVASSTTLHGDTSDGSDATYITLSGADTFTLLDLDDFAMPALAVIHSVTVRIRMNHPAGSSTFGLLVGLYDPTTGTYAALGSTPVGTGAITTYTASNSTTGPGPALWSDSLVDGMQFYLNGQDTEHRVHALYVDVYYNQAPVVAVTAPSGTITSTTQPTVTWTYTDAEGDAQERYRVKVFTAAQYGAGGFDPETSAATWDSGVVLSAATSKQVAVALPNSTTLRAYVKVADVGSGGRYGAWDFEQFATSVSPPAVPVLTATADPTLARINLAVAGRDNLLTTNQASFETDTTGWVAQANCTIAQATPQHVDGAFSMSMTSTGAGELDAATLTGTNGVPVTVGQTYTGLAWIRTAATARDVGVSLSWYDSGGVFLSTDAGATATDSTSFGQVTVTAVAPASAAFAAIKVRVLAVAGAGEIHYVDNVSIAPGSSTTWTRGGLVGTHEAEIERSDDGGTTWAPVSLFYTSGVVWGGPILDAPQNVTVFDYSAPSGVAVKYRARVSATDSGASLTGDWSSVQTATVTISSAWLKNPSAPAENMAVDLQLPTNMERRVKVGVVETLGAVMPITRSDGRKGMAGDAEVWSTSQDEHDALDLLVAPGEVRLLQVPGRGQWYLVPTGNLKTTTQVLVDEDGQLNVDTFPWVEVATP